jgi:choline dehydrogenase
MNVDIASVDHHHHFEPSPGFSDTVRRARPVRQNSHTNTSAFRPTYDILVCGSSSSGSVVARRLAENPDVSVLLGKAGGTDDVPAVTEANQWPLNLGGQRDWGFHGQPNPHVNGRSIPFRSAKSLAEAPEST